METGIDSIMDFFNVVNKFYIFLFFLSFSLSTKSSEQIFSAYFVVAASTVANVPVKTL